MMCVAEVSCNCIIILVKYHGGVYRIMKQKGFIILNNTCGTRIRYKYEYNCKPKGSQY